MSITNRNINFDENCLELLKKIPEGKVTTYKAIANYFDSKAYRRVGQAMKNNKNAPIIPCHRVVGHDGEIGGYAFGVEKKITLLKAEGVEITNGKVKKNFIIFDLTGL